jgi:hypothetical protein
MQIGPFRPIDIWDGRDLAIYSANKYITGPRRGMILVHLDGGLDVLALRRRLPEG